MLDETSLVIVLRHDVLLESPGVLSRPDGGCSTHTRLCQHYWSKENNAYTQAIPLIGDRPLPTESAVTSTPQRWPANQGRILTYGGQLPFSLLAYDKRTKASNF